MALSIDQGARAVERCVTVLGIGRIRHGGGTVSALVALPAACAIGLLPAPLLVLVLAAAIAVGAALIERYLPRATTADPPEVVLDEALGCLVAVALVPLHPLAVGGAFALFRLFDIFKPWPIDAVERLHGAAGVLGDDLVAGLAAAILVDGAWRVMVVAPL